MHLIQKIRGIFRMLAFIAARKLCANSTYHVAWRASTANGYVVGSGTYTVTPWLCNANYSQLVDLISQEAASHGVKEKAVIISITKIGNGQ